MERAREEEQRGEIDGAKLETQRRRRGLLKWQEREEEEEEEAVICCWSATGLLARLPSALFLSVWPHGEGRGG